jgi:membrane fusion protein, multidrug efflux system
MKTMRLVYTLLALAGTALIAGCGVGEASITDEATTQAATPVPVEVARPWRGDIFASYTATATITSDSDAMAIARVPGEVVELYAEEGDRVEAGQVLARLDGRRLRLEMLAARADLEKAQKEYARNKDLHARGLISAAMFDNLKLDLEARQASYELKLLSYNYTEIRAPIAGVVSAREVKPGETVTANQVAFRITEIEDLLAQLQTPQSELSKFSAGDKAMVSVAAIPGARFPATIARISPTIDARNGTFRATVNIDNQGGELAPGMFGTFTIDYEKHANALLIPAAAVISEDDATTVYVVANGEVVRRAIETGIESDGQVEILAGVQEGEEIVVIGHSGLRDGSKVLASNNNADRYSG